MNSNDELKDNLRKVKGIFYLEILDENGNIIEKYEDRNLIVNGGRSAIMQLIGGGGTGTKEVTNIGFGTDGANPIITDTALTNPFSKAVDSVTYPANDSVQFNFSLAAGENNGVTIREFALICADGSLFSRKIRAAIEKTAAISLNGTWTITF